MLKIARIFRAITMENRIDCIKRYEKFKSSSANDINILRNIESLQFVVNKKLGLRKLTIYSCFIWLPRLSLRLIKGKFHLHIIGLIYPEALVGFIIGKLLGRPLVVLDGHWYWPSTKLSKLAWPIAWLIARYSSLLGVTAGAKNFWKRAGISIKKMRFIPLYISVLTIKQEDYVKSASLRKRLGLEGKKVILYFGRLVEYKGVKYLIEAFDELSKEHKNVSLLICGEGPQRKQLEYLCKSKRLANVLFTGFVKPEEKTAYFLLCDVFVHPAITTETPEEWGLAVNEAMSVGKPVVVTQAVGARELINHGVNGYIVPEKNINALANTIKILINNDDLRKEMGYAAKLTIEQKFNWGVQLKYLTDIVNEIYKRLHAQ